MKKNIVSLVRSFIEANIVLLMLLASYMGGYIFEEQNNYDVCLILRFCICLSFCFITYQFRLERYKEIENIKIFTILNIVNIFIFNPFILVFSSSYFHFLCLFSGIYCCYLTSVNDQAIISSDQVVNSINDKKPIKKIKSYIIRMEDINDSAYNPLISAIQNKNSELVRFILQRHADVNVIKHNETTPLLIAVLYNDVDLVSLLISRGANVNYVSNGQTILDCALQNNVSNEIIEILKNNGAKQIK